MSFGADLARRVQPRAAVVHGLRTAAPGTLGRGASTFGHRLGLSHLQREVLRGRSVDELAVRPPADWLPQVDADPTELPPPPVHSPKVLAVVPSGDRKLDALRRMLAASGGTTRRAEVDPGSPARLRTRSERPPVRRSLPRALQRNLHQSGPTTTPGGLVERMVPEPVDPGTIPVPPGGSGRPAAATANPAAPRDKLSRLRTLLESSGAIPPAGSSAPASAGEGAAPGRTVPPNAASSPGRPSAATRRSGPSHGTEPSHGTDRPGASATAVPPLPLATAIRRAPARGRSETGASFATFLTPSWSSPHRVIGTAPGQALPSVLAPGRAAQALALLATADGHPVAAPGAPPALRRHLAAVPPPERDDGPVDPPADRVSRAPRQIVRRRSSPQPAAFDGRDPVPPTRPDADPMPVAPRPVGPPALLRPPQILPEILPQTVPQTVPGEPPRHPGPAQPSVADPSDRAVRQAGRPRRTAVQRRASSVRPASSSPASSSPLADAAAPVVSRRPTPLRPVRRHVEPAGPGTTEANAVRPPSAIVAPAVDQRTTFGPPASGPASSGPASSASEVMRGDSTPAGVALGITGLDAARPVPRRSPAPVAIRRRSAVPDRVAPLVSVVDVAPPAAADPVMRFLGELSRRPTAVPRALPRHLEPLASVIAPDRPVRIRHDDGARRALRAAGKVAATTGDVIHLQRAPATRADVAVVAHELHHVAHPSPEPRFFADERPSPEERQADELADVIRRTPILPRPSAATGPLVQRAADIAIGAHRRDRAPSMPTSPALPGLIGGHRARAGGSSPGTVSAAALAAALAGAVSTPQAAPPPPTDTPAVPSPKGLAMAPPPVMPVAGTVPSNSAAPTPSDRSAFAASTSSGEAADATGFLFPFDLRDTVGTRDFLQWLVEQLGDRMLEQLEQRGGRFRGEY